MHHVKRLVITSGNIQCPACRQKTKIPDEGVNKLARVNFMTRQMKEHAENPRCDKVNVMISILYNLYCINRYFYVRVTKLKNINVRNDVCNCTWETTCCVFICAVRWWHLVVGNISPLRGRFSRFLPDLVEML